MKEERFNFYGDIIRVTAGDGGEALLMIGSEKTALLDTGMAYCGEQLVENLKGELGQRPLDYVILTHSHYDHVAGLPYLRKEWPELVSMGAAYGKKVLEKPSALKLIKELSKTAWLKYRREEEDPIILMDGLKIDKVVGEKDKIELGDKEILVIETPGHTNCSLTFVLEPDHIIFPSESIGVYIEKGTFISPILKSYGEVMKSIEKCKEVGAKHIISPHYGQVPDSEVKDYWDNAKASAEEIKDFILRRTAEGATKDELLNEFIIKFRNELVADQQPKEAQILNSISVINTILKEFG